MNRLQNRIRKLEERAGSGNRKVICLINPTPEEMARAEQDRNKGFFRELVEA